MTKQLFWLGNKIDFSTGGNWKGTKMFTKEEIKEWAETLEVSPEEIENKIRTWDEKQRAVFEYYGRECFLIDDITDLDIDDDEIDINGETILVLTDSEADKRVDEYLDNYLDDCCEIPEWIRPYFNEEDWKRDVLRFDGRGSQLASYDGNEDMEEIEGTDYYIYRVN